MAQEKQSTKARLAGYIISNIHSCPFDENSGADIGEKCQGFGSARCPACVIEFADRLDRPDEPRDKYGNELGKIAPGDYVLYQNGSRFELGRVKRVDREDRVAYVWYSGGDTAARTSFDNLIVLSNRRNILQTDLGGESARAAFA